MKKVIACTGGIGSGKSAIVRAFDTLGVPTYDCDGSVKRLYRENDALKEAVADLLGRDVLRDGVLDFRLMSERLFGNRELLLRLEGIVYPVLEKDIREWAGAQDSTLVLVESAIFLEKAFFANFADFVITVSAPEEVRVARVMARDGLSREKILERMSNQWTDQMREARADYVVRTDDRHPVLPQIIELIEKLKNE